MKTRIVVLGLVAFLFAFGSALASFVDAENAFISAKETSSSDFELIDSGVDCNNPGPEPCEIQVNTELQGIIKVSGRNSSNQVITHTGGTQSMLSPVYDAE